MAGYSVGLKPLLAGTYTAEYHVTGLDGHTVGQSYEFRVLGGRWATTGRGIRGRGYDARIVNGGGCRAINSLGHPGCRGRAPASTPALLAAVPTHRSAWRNRLKNQDVSRNGIPKRQSGVEGTPIGRFPNGISEVLPVPRTTLNIRNWQKA